MSEKRFTAKEAAVAVLKKAEDMIKKYESENSSKLGSKISAIKQDQVEKTDEAYEIESGKKKGKKRIQDQVSPSKNPQEIKEEDAKNRLENLIGKSEKLKKTNMLADKINAGMKQARGGYTGPPAPVTPAVAAGIASGFKKAEKLSNFMKSMSEKRAMKKSSK